MDGGVGGFPRDDDEFATLLHGHDGRARHEVVRDTGGQLSNRGSRAGADDDGIDFRRSRGRFGADVFGVLEDGVGRFRQSFGRGVAFVLQRQFSRVGDDQANGLAHLGEDFCETFAVDGSRCARDADDDLAHGPKPWLSHLASCSPPIRRISSTAGENTHSPVVVRRQGVWKVSGGRDGDQRGRMGTVCMTIHTKGPPSNLQRIKCSTLMESRV